MEDCQRFRSRDEPGEGILGSDRFHCGKQVGSLDVGPQKESTPLPGIPAKGCRERKGRMPQGGQVEHILSKAALERPVDGTFLLGRDPLEDPGRPPPSAVLRYQEGFLPRARREQAFDAIRWTYEIPWFHDSRGHFPEL